jgi:hypothetical protein
MDEIDFSKTIIKLIKATSDSEKFIELIKNYKACQMVVNINKILNYPPSDKIIDDGSINLENKDFMIEWAIMNVIDEGETIQIFPGKKRINLSSVLKDKITSMKNDRTSK